jgi:homoserine O-acetyltransferase
MQHQKRPQKPIEELAEDPNWNGGRYYDKGGVVRILTKIRVATLKSYGIEAQLASQYPDATARETAIAKVADQWAQNFDANSLVVLRRALETYDTTPQFSNIKGEGDVRHFTYRQALSAVDRARRHAGLEVGWSGRALL